MKISRGSGHLEAYSCEIPAQTSPSNKRPMWYPGACHCRSPLLSAKLVAAFGRPTTAIISSIVFPLTRPRDTNFFDSLCPGANADIRAAANRIKPTINATNKRSIGISCSLAINVYLPEVLSPAVSLHNRIQSNVAAGFFRQSGPDGNLWFRGWWNRYFIDRGRPNCQSDGLFSGLDAPGLCARYRQIRHPPHYPSYCAGRSLHQRFLRQSASTRNLAW
jgi:hypothetical protein